jgi:16S rRNA (guanine527-N7)-methyltransferase
MIASEEEARAYVAELCDSAALDRLDRFVKLLREENAHQNLIAGTTLPEIWRRHIADSAQLLGYVTSATPGPWLDLGTGAGFPGLIVAALRPDWDVSLVESRKRRAGWLERMLNELGLHACRVLGKQLELAESFPAGIISARAFAPLAQLLHVSARFSTERTLWLLPKGRSAAQELAALPESMRKMFHVEHSCTDPDAGIIVGRLEQHVRQRE